MTKDGRWRTGNLGCCLKFDCKNRDKWCNQCIRYSKYEAENERDDD